MADLSPDFLTGDAFSIVALTAALNNIENVPGRSGELAFTGVGEGVPVTTVMIESRSEKLSLVAPSARGGPAPQETEDKSDLRSVAIPHIKIEDTILADQVQNVRAFGTTNVLKGPEMIVNQQLTKMSRRLDLTMESLRLGALKGVVLGSDGSTIVDLFDLFKIKNSNNQYAPQEYNVDIGKANQNSDDLRVSIQKIDRAVRRAAKTAIPNTARTWVFCGDNFFDKLVSRPDVKETYKTQIDQERRLGANYAFGAFEYAGVVFENYRGTDDNTTVAVGVDEARGFLTGVPGLYAEYFAPADFWETVNTIGLPRYARLAFDSEFNRFLKLHVQTNPLPLCLRPQTLFKITG